MTQKKKDWSVETFRWVSILEGISFLVLLFIAMPLKYVWEMPEYVRVTGMAHGVLFIAYILGAILMYEKLQWRVKDLAVVILCSVLPFGPFYADKKYIVQKDTDVIEE